ncbi:hypothetical protein [Streptacidiphilus anmyonensis]|uniref:hypothetical protein n=1 Tax=Streptacidiphilus anmyonensis TaxID=405782 RepID=UPI0005A6D5FC|nr:hypothetical protein [Streptacidiphilus anmyonensis]
MSMRKRIKTAASFAAVSVSALAIPLVGAGSAHADSQSGCSYPYVCIYGGTSVNDPIVAEFRDYTSYYQSTNHKNFAVVNTRNQDTVWLRIDYGSGPTYTCLTNASQPNNSIGSSGTLTGIMISSNTSC